MCAGDHNIIYCRSGRQTIIGNVNFHLGRFVEIRTIAPYNGFTLREMIKDNDTERDNPEEDDCHVLLLKCHEICERLQCQRTEVKADFLKLLENLGKVNNSNADDYGRNRNGLMKVFMKKFFADHTPDVPGYENVRDALFSFLANHFLTHGSASDFSLTAGIRAEALPPQFSELPALLHEYLEKSEAERMQLAALQILSGESGKYDWFLQQEFLTLKQPSENED